MYKNQSNKCFICGDFKEKLNIDHNHETGKIRKLSCLPCNVSLGFIKEDIEILQKMINYIKTEGKSIC